MPVQVRGRDAAVLLPGAADPERGQVQPRAVRGAVALARLPRLPPRPLRATRPGGEPHIPRGRGLPHGEACLRRTLQESCVTVEDILMLELEHSDDYQKFLRHLLQ